MNNYPKVSIITVVYNGIEFLEETIKSVISQTYPNIEYIIVDGGSKDGTLDIIKKYEEHITKWISEPDKGIYDAMNKGIDLATGDWQNFLNAGDRFVDNDVLEKIFTTNLKNITLVYGNIIAIRENGQTLNVNAIELKNDNSIKKGMKVCHQAIFYNKNIIIKYDDKLRLKSEWKHLIEITRKENFSPKKFNFPIVYYSVGGLGAQQLKLNQKEYRDVFLKMYGMSAYITYMPFFAYMTLRRILKKILKK
jgi:glycosyltransferase involved in cell wall biosynthesis